MICYAADKGMARWFRPQQAVERREYECLTIGNCNRFCGRISPD